MDYRVLKRGKHGLPTWDALAPLVLKIAKQRLEWHGRELKIKTADSLELPEKLRKLTYDDSNHRSIIEDRAGWAVGELNTAGLLKRTRRGYYKITELGEKLLREGTAINREAIHKQPLYQQHERELEERKLRSAEIVSVDAEPTAVSKLTQQAAAYNAEVATSLLRQIRESEPEFFENLVVTLLGAMGYRGPNGSAWVTQRTNDGGIDGVINQDALGTSTVYVQAKKYGEGNKVQRPAIDSFYGALSRNHADRGVFITTSSFSTKAIDTARGFSIVLVDGIQLTELMLQYHVGVQVKQSFEIFEIDKDFFED
ncbi:restriction endonuclease [Levilactobacillus parabrevis]|uniref:restriction endonuclease n=1 Tax=Levilactobacillus parabrevis TaxID=357278 RepID=UPI0021A57819|nr:restriction endonuclease [Levilactobacillus parabrevis]MCT4486789.1 restriction endonuclease [Levilactobacillus parabrevis]MCT4491149.1 restriction endonuclease [Levilactobacillus parabrevis]